MDIPPRNLKKLVMTPDNHVGVLNVLGQLKNSHVVKQTLKTIGITDMKPAAYRSVQTRLYVQRTGRRQGRGDRRGWRGARSRRDWSLVARLSRGRNWSGSRNGAGRSGRRRARDGAVQGEVLQLARADGVGRGRVGHGRRVLRLQWRRSQCQRCRRCRNAKAQACPHFIPFITVESHSLKARAGASWRAIHGSSSTAWMNAGRLRSV